MVSPGSLVKVCCLKDVKKCQKIHFFKMGGEIKEEIFWYCGIFIATDYEGTLEKIMLLYSVPSERKNISISETNVFLLCKKRH